MVTTAAAAPEIEHLDTQTALAALAGDVTPDELEAHLAHAATCERCRGLADVVVSLSLQAVETATERSTR